MNKACLILSVGLLVTSGQKLLGKTLTALEQAQQAHEIAVREYNEAVNKQLELKQLAGVSKEALWRADEDQRLKYHKSEQTKKDLEAAKADQIKIDAAIAHNQKNQEYAHSQHLQNQYDAPPSYDQAIACDRLAQQVALFKTACKEIKRLNPSVAQELLKEEYKAYNSCWWCR